ncbi:MAG: hypothetical protein Q3961_01145, partial [Bifidobacteriaceae bacterium]|nr:hypothetical protein [Bifidobacteriaceae bacterium]
MLQKPIEQYTAADLQNPALTAQDLHQIASIRTDLWTAIMQSPNCTPELRNLIQQNLQRASQPTPAAPQTAPQAVPQAAPAQPNNEPNAFTNISDNFKTAFNTSKQTTGINKLTVLTPIIWIVTGACMVLGTFLPLVSSGSYSYTLKDISKILNFVDFISGFVNFT